MSNDINPQTPAGSELPPITRQELQAAIDHERERQKELGYTNEKDLRKGSSSLAFWFSQYKARGDREAFIKAGAILQSINQVFEAELRTVFNVTEES